MIRTLVVDDDFMVAQVHRRMVERVAGFTVVGEARTGAEALERVRELRPDLVLLDVYLPDIGGTEVLRRLRTGDGPPVDVLMITAARDAETVRRALHGGAVHYIVKPFAPETLRERLLRYQEARGVLEGGEAAQEDLDRVFGAPRSGQVPPGQAKGAAMPKGLTPESAALVRSELEKTGADLSASECAALTGLSRVSARRYLEHFVQEGRAVVRLKYGTAGRPERRYHWVRGAE